MNEDNRNVTAADFVRHFAKYREAAQTGPVIVTNHGRKTHALLSIADYEEAQGYASKSASGEAADPLEVIENFANWISESLMVMDHDLKIETVNQQLEMMLHKSRKDLIGLTVTDLHVNIRGSVAESLLIRTSTTGQSSVADFPSFFNVGRWIHMRCFPWGDHIVALFRDITEEVTNFRLADVKESILAAMDIHGGIGYARLSPRGTIDRCDKALAKKLGLNEDRLVGVPFVDLVDVKSRVEFREALEKCLRNNVGERIQTSLLTNSGTLLSGVAGIHGLHGAYGVEGAIVVLTIE
ncbi:hypothetical protein AMC99_01138 [Altererythrobacter epoxidivorans]|uniref:PAS domain-containing protein n=1 Tax=Altererythrobacter epoxidivorans TaxID=361183 RepID=A0A0M4LUT8_9SPHN|nr:type II toxin-antitoxin system prevent-host-death family antitoxin [Altererythrobacter epoxidivorans]ALE16434.1 hypothetical protein AMC99_01138 [Altererythrobacter epoxidivorans]